MKRLMISTIIAMGCFLPVQAFASETTSADMDASSKAAASTLNAGITPDSILYPLDKMIESSQLWLASSDISKAELLSENTNERLAEAKAMLDQNKDSLSADTLQEYEDTLIQLEKQTNSAINNNEDVTEVVNSVDNAKKAIDTTFKDISDNLKSDDSKQIISEIQDTQTAIKDITDSVNLVNSTVESETVAEDGNRTKESPLKEKITELVLATQIGSENLTLSKNDGLNLRQIMAIQALASKSGKSYTEVLSIFLQNEKGIGITAKALNLKPSDAIKLINSTFRDMKKEIQTAFKTEQKKQKEYEKVAVDKSTNANITQESADTENSIAENGDSKVISSGKSNGSDVSKAAQDAVKNQELQGKAVSNAVHQAIPNQTKQEKQNMAVTSAPSGSGQAKALGKNQREAQNVQSESHESGKVKGQ